MSFGKTMYQMLIAGSQAYAKWDLEVSTSILKKHKKMLFLLALAVPMLIVCCAEAYDAHEMLGGKSAYAPAFYTTTIFLASIAVGLAAKKVDVAVGKLARPLHGVDVLELDEGGGVGAEAVFLHVERYEDAVDHQDEVFSIDTVEDVVVDLHGYLSMHAVGLAQPSNLVYFVLSDHVMRVMWAPSALSLFSMFS